MEEKIPDKLFYKIREVTTITGVKPYVLRYWESEFGLLNPQKGRSGQRTYRKRDIETILQIKKLLYDECYTIAGAKRKLLSSRKGRRKAKEAVLELREQLQSLLLLLNKDAERT
ncbi:MAG: MerR family transcriptional regulator [Candidatus Binatia bacterium]